MELEDLRRFEPLFKHSRHLAADDVLRRYLGVGADYPIPLTISHGVDFGFSTVGYDVFAVEPIYWATNPRSYELAARVKPAIKIPHPFLLASLDRDLPAGEGTLVVGPPPGPVNDAKLADLLTGYDPATTTILVKPHPNFDKSAAFWAERGYRTVCVADEGPPTYDRMVSLFSRYAEFVGCTVSSAIFFGAALGKRVTLMRGFRYAAYESTQVHSVMDYRSKEAGAAVKALVAGSVEESTQIARQLLGSGFVRDPDAIRAEIDQAVRDLKWPLHSRTRHPPPIRRLLQNLALKMNRPSLLNRSYSEIVMARFNRDVLIVDLDEVSLWLDGANEGNLGFSKTRYVPGVREPGAAIDQY